MTPEISDCAHPKYRYRDNALGYDVEGKIAECKKINHKPRAKKVHTRNPAEILSLREFLDKDVTHLDAQKYMVWETLKWVLDEDEIEGDFLASLGLRAASR